MTELLALARIVAGYVKGGLGDTYGDGAYVDTATVQGREGDFEALSLFTEAVECGDGTIFKDQFSRGGGVQPHFALCFAKGEARRSFLDDETANACPALAGAGTRHQQVDVGLSAVGYPHF